MDMSPPAPLIASPRRRLAAFCFLLSAMFMATLDHQIVSTALPTIVGEFGELERFGWLGSSFLLASSAVMPIYGKLGDLFGRKYVMAAAMAIFLVGSLTCGLAWSMDSLIAARVLQGLGGGGIMVSIFAINADLFEPRERARYQSYSSLVLMASGALGPLAGGAMSEAFGWRSIFLINLPVGAVALAGIVLLLPYRRPHRRPKIDYAGALLLAATMASIVAWADSTTLFGSLLAPAALGILAAGGACALLWVVVERRAPEPVIPLTLFRDPTFPLFLAISLCAGGVAIGLGNYFALFLQTTSGLSPTAAGLFFIATSGGIVIGSLLTGRLVATSGRYKPFSVIGLILNVAALMLLARFAAGAPLPLIAGLMLMQGIGIGFGQQVPVIAVQNSAPPEDVGAATGAVTLMRMAGASIAISLYGAIVAANLDGAAITGITDIAALTPAMMAELPEPSRRAVAAVYGNALTHVFTAAAAIALAGLVAAVALRNVRLPAGKR